MTDLSGLRLAAYARYSSDLQSEESIDDQFRLLRRYVERNGGEWALVRCFYDAAESGASMDRPGIQDLLGRVNKKQPEFEVILVESIDRLSRTLADTASLCDDLDFAQVRLIAVSENIDTSDPNARLMLGIKGTLAQQYLTELGNKTRRGLRGAAEKGLSTGGLPHGYKSVPQRHEKGRSRQSLIQVEEETADVVRRIFKLWIEGHSYRSIAGILNQEGIPTPRGARKRNGRGWPDTTIRAILRNPMYIGRRTFGARNWKKPPRKKSRRYRAAPKDDIQHVQQPELRIIDQKTWDAAQARIEDVAGKYTGKKNGRAPTRKTNYPLSGLLVCGHCGANFSIIGGSSCRYYRCTDAHRRKTCSNTQPLREDQISDAILSLVRKQLSDPAAIAYLAETLRRNASQAASVGNADTTKFEREIAKLEKRVDNLIEAIASGDLAGAALKGVQTKLTEEQTRKTILEEKLREASQASSATRRVPTKEDLTARAAQLIQRLDELLKKDPVRAREQLRHFIHGGRIEMHPRGEDGWVARFRLYPALVLEKPTKGIGPGANSEAVYFASCAGRI